MQTNRLVSGFAMLIGLSAGVSCSDGDSPAGEPKAAGRGSELQEEERIAIDVKVDNVWVTIHPTKSGIQDLAREYCEVEVQGDENTPCHSTQSGGQPSLTPPSGAIPTRQALENSSSANYDCMNAVCHARKENCAGAMLEELAVSPVAREIQLSTPIQKNRLNLTPEDLKVIGEAPAFDFRLNPALGSAGASALRASLEHYAESAKLAHIMRTTVPGSASDAGAASGTCTDLLSGAGSNSEWLTLHLSAFIEAVTRYSQVMRRSTSQTKSAAMTRSLGAKSPAEQSRRRWNSGPDSMVSAARTLAYGKLSSGASTTPPALNTYRGAADFAKFFNPRMLPACPPKTGNLGLERAINTARNLGISPKVVGSGSIATFGDAIAKAHVEDQARLGVLTQAPGNMDEVLANLGITKADAELAEEYLRTESVSFGLSAVPRPTSTVDGFQHVERAYGTGKPSRLPSGVIAAQFLGETEEQSLRPDEDDYGKAGAVRAIDQMRMTAYYLAVQASNKQHALSGALDTLRGSLEADVGRMRVEFKVGNAGAESGTVESVWVSVLGADSRAQYMAVQGIPALKCVLSGAIDGAPCNSEKLATAFGAVVSSSSAYAADLKGQDQASVELGPVYRPSATTPTDPPESTAILDSEAIYVLERNAGQLRVIAAAIPKPGPSPIEDKVTRRLVVPAGGIIQDEIDRVIAPDPEDCSEPEESCVGLPASLVPPLGSEIVGEQTSQSYESGWKYYLEVARKTADEADRLGEELVQTGLAIDQVMDGATKNLMDLCGADGKGCANFEQSYATLGDKRVCLWIYNNEVCKSYAGAPLTCPFIPSDEGQDCQAALLVNGQKPAGVMERTAVPLKMATTPENLGQFPSCRSINELRAGIDEPREREKKIRELASAWNASLAAEAAATLKYTELFADNYRLEYGGETVFDTSRRVRPSLNEIAKAPCKANGTPGPDDSAFWSRPLDCYESGKDGNCANSAFGADGCQWQNKDAAHFDLNAASASYYSMDTEPAALRRRWAWGFGHLRRSMATLGLITGQLGNTMALARVLPAAMRFSGPGFDVIAPNPVPGTCEPGPSQFNDPEWVQHCEALGCGDECRETVRCIDPYGLGPDGHLHRDTFGRPVNKNGFIGNWLAGQEWPGFGAYSADGTGFPWIHSPDPNGGYTYGVDPQMVYCGLPYAEPLTSPTAWEQWGTAWPTGICNVADGCRASGWVGASATNDIGATYTPEWQAAVQQMWEVPSGEFCTESPPGGCADPSNCWQSAVWRAFCSRLPDPPLDELMKREDFMYLGRFNGLEENGPTFVNASTAGQWLQPIPGDWEDENWRHATVAYLYDLRQQPYLAGGYVVPLQYEVTARGIVDAMDLLCHATRNQSGKIRDCGTMNNAGFEPSDMNEIGDYLGCIQERIREVGGRYVVGPVPTPVIDAFTQSVPIASTTGLGGAYLDGMVEERAALEAISTHYDHVADALQQMGYLSTKFAYLHRAQGFEMQEAKYRGIESTMSHMASAMSSMAQATSTNNLMSFGVSGGFSVAAAASEIAAMKAGALATEFGMAAMSLTHQTELFDLVQSMRDNAATARDSVTQIYLEMDKLTSAAAKVRLVQAKGEREGASATLADYWDCEDPNGCPIPYNTALRRTYNTKLVRYGNALKRAKEAAFVARRAIEVRFGVKLSRIYEPMAFVQEPHAWADSVCEMEGIRYDKIREADGGNQSIDFSKPGDDYADDFIGDYVTKLEDFVRSYPFDFPLKESDDTAVLSVSEDLLKVSGDCVREADNLLLWSSDFDQPTAWSIGGCNLHLPDADGGTGPLWQGCLSLTAAYASVTGLPTTAKPYLLRNATCTPSDGDHGTNPRVCPTTTSYPLTGSISQGVTIKYSGMHRASVYVKQHSVSAGNTSVAVVNETSGKVDKLDYAPIGTWERLEVAFGAVAGDRVRLVIKPSEVEAGSNSVPPDPDDWPGVLVAGAQVEWVPTFSVGQAGSATAFQRTTEERLVRDPVCHKFDGAELRRRFGPRKCERFCMSGVSGECATQEEQAKAPERCFHEASITLPIEAVQQGALSPSGQLAAGNFNYRHNTIGVNIIGTGVHDCENVPGAACYQNGFVEYTLVHDGATSVSNWGGGLLKVDMPTARIEHGKALAAERVLTNPPSSSDAQLLEPYTKADFRGRPIHGNYLLRIWESPGFVWDRVEDVQLVWRYHYWTRQDKTN